jgi:hypothetical protein
MTADAAEVGESLRLTIIGLDKCFRGEGCEMVRSIGKIDTLLRVGRKVALPRCAHLGLVSHVRCRPVPASTSAATRVRAAKFVPPAYPIPTKDISRPLKSHK